MHRKVGVQGILPSLHGGRVGRAQFRLVYTDIRYVGCGNALGTVVAAENADTRRFLRASAFVRETRAALPVLQDLVYQRMFPVQIECAQPSSAA